MIKIAKQTVAKYSRKMMKYEILILISKENKLILIHSQTRCIGIYENKIGESRKTEKKIRLHKKL